MRCNDIYPHETAVHIIVGNGRKVNMATRRERERERERERRGQRK